VVERIERTSASDVHLGLAVHHDRYRFEKKISALSQDNKRQCRQAGRQRCKRVEIQKKDVPIKGCTVVDASADKPEGCGFDSSKVVKIKGA
jgi:hypothetical protein